MKSRSEFYLGTDDILGNQVVEMRPKKSSLSASELGQSGELYQHSFFPPKTFLQRFFFYQQICKQMHQELQSNLTKKNIFL